MLLEQTSNGFTISKNNLVIFHHSFETPIFFIGYGEERMDMYCGNFDIEDYITQRIALTYFEIDGNTLRLYPSKNARLALSVTVENNGLNFSVEDKKFNRFWLRVKADQDENIWGGGEQMSYFDMRGRRFPLWTSEPGVGRDKSTEITFLSDKNTRSGGDYYNTNYPQPTYISSKRYALHVDTTAYSIFDFRHDNFHEIEIWAMPTKIEIFAKTNFCALVSELSLRFGRQPKLPEWVYQGAIIGLKEGEKSFDRLEKMKKAGVKISALWCEDWVGLRHTSFGARLFWDWKASEERYPNLQQKIAQLAKENIRFLGYVNPYLCVDGSFFPIAEKHGYFAKDKEGKTALVDFGEFHCGVVDFTNDEAFEWFAETILGQNMLDFGLEGWMADFGEYLPINIQLANGVDAKLMHNAWPTLWAKVNAKAIKKREKTGEALFFMRAGYTGVQAYCPLLWAGDQSVDFSRHDGLVTVMAGALSSGLLGNAYHHSDIGGYTSLYGNIRSAELLMRWAEMAAFTPIMRSHEGNRPQDNLQIDQDTAVLNHFAHMTKIYVHLAPYLKNLSQEAVKTGLPVQRPLFLHFEDDRATYAIQDAYLYGPDLLVAPVWHEGATTRTIYLPKDTHWIHVWSNKEYQGGNEITVLAPIGHPAIFFKKDSIYANLFADIKMI